MDRLGTHQESGAAWNLQCDKDLLTALQDLSGDLMSSINKIEAGLSDLERGVAHVSDQLGSANLRYNEICEQRYVEQAVQTATAQGSREARPPRLQKQQTLDADNFAEIVHPKYKEALALCSQAFREKPRRLLSEDNARMPFIFGSPEYLQDASFGVREASASDLPGPAEEAEAGGRATDVALSRADPDDDGHQAATADVPDLRAMLEAALRGDLDESALALLDDTGSEPPLPEKSQPVRGQGTSTGGEHRREPETEAQQTASDGEDWKDADDSEEGFGGGGSHEALKELLSGGDDLFSEEELETR